MVGRAQILSIGGGLLVAGCVLLLGCNQFAERANRQAATTAESKPADYSASTKIGLVFDAANKVLKPPKPNMLARLDYKIQDATDPPLSMELVDPDHPQGTVVKQGGYEVHINTFIGSPQITHPNAHECLVQGAYTICILSDKGEHLGEFEVNPGGHLVYKGGTSDHNIAVRMINTVSRTMYTIHRRSVAGAPGAAFLDVEFRPADQVVEHKTETTDGWTYRFDFWDGTLWLHPADHMGDVPEQLEVLAKAEEANRAAGLSYSDDTGGWIDGASSSSFSGGCG